MVNTDQPTPLPFIDPQSATTTYSLTQFDYDHPPQSCEQDDIEQARKEEQERFRRKNERELWKLARKEAQRR